MKILLATNNANKANEIKKILNKFEILSLNEVLKPFEIEENGANFKENASIKAHAVFEKLSQNQRKEFVVLSDDSGLCVDALNGAPGVFSARFFEKEGGKFLNNFKNLSADAANRALLIEKLNSLKINKSPSKFIACVAVKSMFNEAFAFGELCGEVINSERGKNGFGYDPLFVPEILKIQNNEKTLAELKENEKNEISHRFKALKSIEFILRNLQKYLKS